ncbi:MAG TPA: carbamoyltransferase C-terminal domain-containing protein, partial [Opitutus sp.]|nr:carbamoyltransferase C-terminal domain-containing protein [Opitutus sp.]
VANARLLREGPFRRLWVQPAAGDAGGALGAALAFHHLHHRKLRAANETHDAMHGSFLGPSYSDADIAAALTAYGLTAEPLATDARLGRLAGLLASGEVIGFFQGRAEFGPRALGARSILADARSPEMQRRLNLKIKHRESFRPFAPIVLAERAAEWFDLDVPSPYMLLTAPVRNAARAPGPASPRWEDRVHQIRSAIPAVTHVDGSARVQTVDRHENPALHAVLSAFAERTGCPVLVNTSFNVRGEPPVCHPREALEGFLATDMDALAIGSFVLEKKQLPAALVRARPARVFAPD